MARAAPTDRDFGAAVLDVVAAIPPGTVMTYGDVAAVLGSRAARAVGTVMSRSEGTTWWRVVRAGGHPPTGLDDRAHAEYLREGTPLVVTASGYRVDLLRARHRP